MTRASFMQLGLAWSSLCFRTPYNWLTGVCRYAGAAHRCVLLCWCRYAGDAHRCVLLCLVTTHFKNISWDSSGCSHFKNFSFNELNYCFSFSYFCELPHGCWDWARSFAGAASALTAESHSFSYFCKLLAFFFFQFFRAVCFRAFWISDFQVSLTHFLISVKLFWSP